MTHRRAVIRGLIAVLLVAVGAAGALLLDRTPARTEPGPTDIGFCQDMTVHHSQAVEMAQIIDSGPADPAVLTLARGIIASQMEEIGRMQGFLTLWEAPTVADTPMSWMSAPHGGHAGHEPATSAAEHSAMMGMATQDQLQRLRTSAGRDREVLFLQLMLRHHQGAVAMAEIAKDHGWIGQVVSLAGRMAFDQTQEIQRIAQMLVQRGVDPNQPPP